MRKGAGGLNPWEKQYMQYVLEGIGISRRYCIHVCFHIHDVSNLCMMRSDVCLYICIAGQDVSIGAALGLLGRWGAGQHVGSCGGLLWWCLTSLEPVVDQGHKEQHHAPHHRRHTSQGEGHCVIPKIVMQETCAEEVRKQNANGKIKTSALDQADSQFVYTVYTHSEINVHPLPHPAMHLSYSAARQMVDIAH